MSGGLGFCPCPQFLHGQKADHLRPDHVHSTEPLAVQATMPVVWSVNAYQHFAGKQNKLLWVIVLQ